MRRIPFYFLLVAMLFSVACSKDKMPEGTLSKSELTDFLYDYQLAQAIVHQTGDSVAYRQRVYMDALLAKYKLSSAEFDSTLAWYARHPKEFAEVYAEVEKRFADSNKKGSATNLQIAQGDTAAASSPKAIEQNYWKGGGSYLLSAEGKSFMTFTQEANGLVQEGDILEWHVATKWIYREGLKAATIALSLVYENDSISNTSMTISSSGEQMLSIAVKRGKVKTIRGFIQQNARATEGVKLLYLDDFALFVRKGAARPVATVAETEQDSLERRREREQKLQDSLLRPNAEPHFR